MNMMLSSEVDLWKRDLLLHYRLDRSYPIADMLCAYLFPLLGKSARRVSSGSRT